MSLGLTEKEFAKHVDTTFIIKLEPNSLSLQLESVKTYAGYEGEQEGLERFSIFFTGPGQWFVPQGTYLIQHESMGEFPLFLVPIAKTEEGFRYEAVFNYFKESESS